MPDVSRSRGTERSECILKCQHTLDNPIDHHRLWLKHTGSYGLKPAEGQVGRSDYGNQPVSTGLHIVSLRVSTLGATAMSGCLEMATEPSLLLPN